MRISYCRRYFGCIPYTYYGTCHGKVCLNHINITVSIHTHKGPSSLVIHSILCWPFLCRCYCTEHYTELRWKGVPYYHNHIWWYTPFLLRKKWSRAYHKWTTANIHIVYVYRRMLITRQRIYSCIRDTCIYSIYLSCIKCLYVIHGLLQEHGKYGSQVSRTYVCYHVLLAVSITLRT